MMSKKLAEKVAVITASTDGIGFAIARRLAIDGARVIVSSRKEKNVQRAVKKLYDEGLKDVTGCVCHVGKSEDRINLLDTAQKTYGGIDILISNAAANPFFGNIENCSDEQWDKIFDINVKCAFQLTKEVLPFLRKRSGGNIIYVSSIAGLQPFSFLGPYSISKTSLIALTKVFSDELAASNIRVNCLAPGIIETKFSEPLHANQTARDFALSQIPMKRFGTPDDIAGIASFLCSDDAQYITGEAIVISGGMKSRL